MTGTGNSSTIGYWAGNYIVNMRATPTGSLSTTSFNINNGTSNITGSGCTLTFYNSDEASFFIAIDGFNTMSGNQAIVFRYPSSDFMILTAEL